jgi:hypothetical protein
MDKIEIIYEVLAGAIMAEIAVIISVFFAFLYTIAPSSFPPGMLFYYCFREIGTGWGMLATAVIGYICGCQIYTHDVE